MGPRDLQRPIAQHYATASLPIAKGGPYADSKMIEIPVTSQEASLLTAFRRLAPDAAGELSRLIERLGAVAPECEIDWFESWSEEDLKEFRSASLRRLEEHEAEEAG